MTQQHICFDLETLGNNSHSPIIAIGAVKFDIEKGIYDTFYVNVYYPYGIPEHYKVDYSTIMWWMQQSNEAREMLIYNKDTLYNSITSFLNWIDETWNFDDCLYWSMSTFDFPILNWAIKNEIADTQGLPYTMARDYRTIKDLLKLEYPPFEGVKHNALDDARNEALLIIKGLRKLQ